MCGADSCTSVLKGGNTPLDIAISLTHTIFRVRAAPGEDSRLDQGTFYRADGSLCVGTICKRRLDGTLDVVCVAEPPDNEVVDLLIEHGAFDCSCPDKVRSPRPLAVNMIYATIPNSKVLCVILAAIAGQLRISPEHTPALRCPWGPALRSEAPWI